jgi:hypothetical protein
MTNRFDSSDRDILNYRPEIVFVEPEAEIEVPVGETPLPTLEEDKKSWEDLGRMALLSKLLADVFQDKISRKVGDFTIGLDPNNDAAVIAAMARKYPEADPTKITYQQYRECREGMRDRSDSMANALGPDENLIKEMRMNPMKSQLDAFGLNTPNARQGLLRPDLEKYNQVVEPIDLESFQDALIRRLMNLLWKKFVKPALRPLIPPPMDEIIPDEIA